MIHMNRKQPYTSLYNRLLSVVNAYNVRMLDYVHGQACGVSIEILGCSKEEQRYNELLVKIVEQKEKEFEGRGLI
ncbi:hypothetical protein D3C84_569730 [compost metagenome]